MPKTAYHQKLRNESLPRARKARRMKQAGKTLEEIGAELGGISRQRVAQLIKRVDGSEG